MMQKILHLDFSIIAQTLKVQVLTRNKQEIPHLLQVVG